MLHSKRQLTSIYTGTICRNMCLKTSGAPRLIDLRPASNLIRFHRSNAFSHDLRVIRDDTETFNIYSEASANRGLGSGLVHLPGFSKLCNHRGQIRTSLR